MGLGGSKREVFTEKELEEYVDLTYFTRKDILRLHKIFINLVQPNQRITSNSKDIRASEQDISSLPYLECNPFSDRICRVFSTSNDGRICFDDFVDMMNVFHHQAPLGLKIEYAFKIYDFNEDDLIDVEDIEVIVTRLVNKSGHLSPSELEILIKNVFAEADLDNDQSLSFAEFEHVITKSVEFINSFNVRV